MKKFALSALCLAAIGCAPTPPAPVKPITNPTGHMGAPTHAAPATAPADGGAAKPADKPADAPADKPADAPADKPADKPADAPADKPADAPKDGDK